MSVEDDERRRRIIIRSSLSRIASAMAAACRRMWRAVFG